MTTPVFKEYENYPASQKAEKTRALAYFYNEHFPLSRWSAAYLQKIIDQKGSFCLILEEEGKISGLLLASPDKINSETYLLRTLLVDKSRQKRGFGRLMLQEAFARLKNDRNARRIYLHFRDSNDLKGFYGNIGFTNHKIIGRYSNGEKKHYMDLVL